MAMESPGLRQDGQSMVIECDAHMRGLRRFPHQLGTGDRPGID
jgi:hypothetical protein